MSENAQQKLYKIFFFGDSIFFGQGVSPQFGWVPRLSLKLDEIGRAYGAKVLVQNPSVNGNTTRQALERMPFDVQSHEPDIVFVQFGMNDCNYWATDRGIPRVSPEAFAANLIEIVKRALCFGAKHVVISTNHPTIRDQEKFLHVNKTYEASNMEYNQIIRSVSGELNSKVTLVDIERVFRQRIDNSRELLASMLLDDGLHLSELGHNLYFETVEPVAVQLLLDQIGGRPRGEHIHNGPG